MTDRNEKAKNPYRTPSAQLVDDFRGESEWSEFTIRRAKEFTSFVNFGYVGAVFIYLFATLALDIVLHGWHRGSAYEIPSLLLFSFTFVVLLACVVPYSEYYVRYQRRRRDFSGFVKLKQKQLRRPYNRPFAMSLLMLLISFFLLLYEEGLSTLPSFEFTWLTERHRALVALPVVIPAVYFGMVFTHRNAKKMLEEVSRNT